MRTTEIWCICPGGNNLAAAGPMSSRRESVPVTETYFFAGAGVVDEAAGAGLVAALAGAVVEGALEEPAAGAGAVPVCAISAPPASNNVVIRVFITLILLGAFRPH